MNSSDDMNKTTYISIGVVGMCFVAISVWMKIDINRLNPKANPLAYKYAQDNIPTSEYKAKISQEDANKLIAALMISEEIRIRGYSAGAIAFMMGLRILSYTFILGIVAWLVSGLRRNVKRYLVPTLCWLMMAAGLFDVGVSGYEVFMVRPQFNKSVEQMKQSGLLDQILSEYRQKRGSK